MGSVHKVFPPKFFLGVIIPVTFVRCNSQEALLGTVLSSLSHTYIFPSTLSSKNVFPFLIIRVWKT